MTRHSDKAFLAHQVDNQLFGVDFHDFLVKEQHNSMVELASEFGLSVRDVKHLKKKLGRSRG